MLIPCPHCGPRDDAEFHYGGEADVRYPERPADLDDRAWARYLFVRANERGSMVEQWQHAGGCRRWFELVRDTATHAIGEPRPLRVAEARS